MKVLVINSGSSSVKYQLIDPDRAESLARGLVEKIGEEGARIRHEAPGRETAEEDLGPIDHAKGIEIAMSYLVGSPHGVLASLVEIEAVGHRVVHGGEEFSASTLITEEVVASVRKFCRLAPLHNPANLTGILACRKLLPGVPQVAVFDTAFHQTLPPKAWNYALPYDLYMKHGIRRYGFHGTSHRYVMWKAAKTLGGNPEDFRIITCHLGNGCSVAAIDRGRSVDTSMGFTPLEGLVMGTRSGDLDPAIVLYVMENEGIDAEGMDRLLNKKSGLLGVSGKGNDMRDIEEAARGGDERCDLALRLFAYRVKKYIGAYTAVLGGLDVLVFTAGIGEHHALSRRLICENLDCLGIRLDEARNGCLPEDGRISVQEAPVTVLVVPTNEEMAIAYDTREIVEGGA